jgi:hypothetical protein
VTPLLRARDHPIESWECCAPRPLLETSRYARNADDIACFDGLLSLSARDRALAEENTEAS